MDFLWTQGLTPPAFPALDGDRNTDVLVIGGGMAGVLCALHLQQAGVDSILVEGKQLGSGVTKGTTAVLTAQHDTLYQELIQRFGAEKAALYLQANLRAVAHFRALSQHISCDFEEKPSLMYTQGDKTQLEQEAAAVRSLGFDAAFITKTPLPFPVAGAVRYPGMAQFHPLKFLYQAAAGLSIYENTFVRRLEGTTAFTEHGTIHAKKVIIATHFPFVNRHGLYFAKLYQRRSYVIALENAPDLGCTIADAAESGVYLRNYHGLLLVGGGDHRTGQQGDGFSAPRAFAARYFPGARQKYYWANQDCVSLDGAPYIGPYSSALPDVFVAAGFNLWGMTSSMLAAEILTDMALGKENRFAPAFRPDRRMYGAQLFANMGTTLLDFVSPTAKRCPHMGCALRWNPEEHSWDCPCHGSRFDAHGGLLDNPARRDAHVE